MTMTIERPTLADLAANPALTAEVDLGSRSRRLPRRTRTLEGANVAGVGVTKKFREKGPT
jgi:hypothetical protein